MLPPRRTALALLVVSCLATAARGQLPQPRLTSVSRAGMARGESVDLTLRGTDLEGVNRLWFDHPGLRAFHLKNATFRVACAAGTPIGQHDVRAVGPFGVSNPRTFVVGARPEAVEVEPNNTPSQATALALNSVVNGELAAADVDCFAFDGKKGRRVFLELDGERIESRLDATLRVLGPDGAEIAECRDAFGSDPFLDLTLPADGRYVVKVHDVTYGGSPDHVYRLTLSDGPRLDAIVPVVAVPGVETTFTLIGRNLGGAPAPDLLADGRPLERKAIALATPSDGASAPALGFLPSPMAARRGFEWTFEGPGGPSNPVFVAEAVDPVVVEREPNDDGEHAQEVVPPCDVSGTFGAPNDLDVYRFRSKKGDIWWIEASAERLGSPADPVFLVQKVVEKAAPQDLATGEDSPDQGGAARFHTGSVDAAVRWQAPDDGLYQVAINDLYTSQRGDARLSYRLNIRPERPDFRVVIVPASANQVDAVSIGAGGRASAYALALRADGFTGAIRVEPRALPPGVRCDPVVIAAGQPIAPIVFEAAEDAAPVVGPATFVATSRWGDRKDDLRYRSGVATLGPDRTHEALAGGMIGPPPNAQAPTITYARADRGFVVAVREPAPLTLTAQPAEWTVAQGRQLDLDLTVTRRAGFAEAVAVAGADLPANVTATAATVAKTDTKGTATLFVAKNAAPGTYTILLRGTGPYPFSKDPNAKTKPNVTLNEPSNPVTVIVRPAPVALTVNNKGGALKAGGTLEIDATIARQNGFADGLTLTLAAPGALKLSAEPVPILAGQTVAKLIVRATPETPVGATAGVVVRAVATVRGETIEVDEPLALTIGK